MAYIDHKMNNAKWKNKLYSITGDKRQTMGRTGCGPTAAADVIASFCDRTVTPWDVAKWFMQKGFRTKSSGTKWSAMRWVAKKYRGKGIRRFAACKCTEKKLRAALSQGALAVCSMGKGYWTNSGHFIVAHKMDETSVYALDPGSKTRKKQAIAPFIKECRKMFVFWPG